jgi:hypothetical protein
MLAALTLMVVVSAAAAALASHLARQGRRTIQAAASAQLHQLLQAGAMHATIWIDRPDLAEPETIVPLPAALLERGASLRLRLVPQPRVLERHVQVEAAFEGRAARQLLRFVKTRSGWPLAEATPQ